METLNLISFKVHKTAQPFRINENINPFSQPMFPVDWLSNNPYDLSLSLNNQVRNNYMELEALRVSSDEASDIPMFTVKTIDSQVAVVDYPMTCEQKSKACKLFIERSNDYDEVISRDQDALNYDDVDVELHAVVLIFINTYHGHIYAWLGKNNYCYAMGIRNKVDSIFTRSFENNLKNVSHFLLEGVRLFALSKGASEFVVTYPKPIMVKILPTLGFENMQIQTFLIGNSISPRVSETSFNCYKLKDINQAIITTRSSFTLCDEQ
jgi:hypothetical protein